MKSSFMLLMIAVVLLTNTVSASDQDANTEDWETGYNPSDEECGHYKYGWNSPNVTLWKCRHDARCIRSDWICDGEFDCVDRSDEEGCEHRRCYPEDELFTCPGDIVAPYRKCIPIKHKCDGQLDCLTAADEADCPDTDNFSNGCPKGKFSCIPDAMSQFPGNFSYCLPNAWLCDKEIDCVGAVDEVPENCTRALEPCQDNEFQCEDREKCIFKEWLCDGDDDCTDGSDERQNCINTTCPPDKFKCISKRHCIGSDDCNNGTCCRESGHCMPKLWLCDGEMDCVNGTDELGCAHTSPALLPHKNLCAEDETSCTHVPQCIKKVWRCDGEHDCMDHSDEENCDKETLHCSLEDHFRCEDTTVEATQLAQSKDGNITRFVCIPGAMKCNGEKDCPDGSDEKDCPTAVLPGGLCKEGYFRCDDRTCIPYSKLCDGKVDCPNNNDIDEALQMCDAKKCSQTKDQKSGCSHNCLELPKGRHCTCKKGYELSGWTNCVNIDECAIPGTCSQNCTDLPGSWKCSCYPGYLMLHDKRTCRALGRQAPVLLLTDRINIREIDLRTKEYVPLIRELHAAIAMDYIYSSRTLVWSDVVNETIYKCAVTTPHGVPISAKKCMEPVIQEKMSSSDGLAVDWIHNLLYYTDTGHNRISVIHLDTKHRKTLFDVGLDEPRAIAVDPKAGKMFWSDWGKEAKIETAHMDGIERTAIVTKLITWPNGLAVDILDQKVYWADAKLKAISSCDYNGNNRRTIIQSWNQLRHPFSISVFEEKVYWTDWDTESVHAANKFNGESGETIVKGLHGPMTVRVYHELNQPDLPDKCQSHECDHLCLPRPHDRYVWRGKKYARSYSCACDNKYALDPDMRTCRFIEKHGSAVTSKQTGRITLTTMAVLALFALVLAALLYLWRRRSTHSPLKNMNFDNPVYRRTVEDVNFSNNSDRLQLTLDEDQYHQGMEVEGTSSSGGTPSVYVPVTNHSSAKSELREPFTDEL